MTPEQFCYWLQGFAEIHQDQPNGQEWLIIMDHLAQVFRKETPDRQLKINKRDMEREAERQTNPFRQNDPFRYPDQVPGWPGKTDIIC